MKHIMYKGQNAIKNEISQYMYKRIMRWYFKRHIEYKTASSLKFYSHEHGSAVIHLIFQTNSKSRYQLYRPECHINNIAININDDFINTRFYENGSTTDYPYGHPMIDINYDYMQAFNDKNIIKYNNKIPIMHNPKLANTWLSQAIATPILKTCDYFVTSKKAPNYNEHYSTNTDKAKLIMSNMEPFIINNKYINIQHPYSIGEIWYFYY